MTQMDAIRMRCICKRFVSFRIYNVRITDDNERVTLEVRHDGVFIHRVYLGGSHFSRDAPVGALATRLLENITASMEAERMPPACVAMFANGAHVMRQIVTEDLK